MRRAGGGKSGANAQHWKRKGAEEGAATSCKSLSLDMWAYAGLVVQFRIVGSCPNCRSLLAQLQRRDGDDVIDGRGRHTESDGPVRSSARAEPISDPIVSAETDLAGVQYPPTGGWNGRASPAECG
jgi:hypothetical protein